MEFMNFKKRKEIIRTALGESKADVVFRGGLLVNVYSGEILPNLWVAFKGDRIAYVGPPDSALMGDQTKVHDLKGRFILPGLIDGHTHLDGIFSVRNYARYALLYGNTTAVSEVSMIANAAGVEGVESFLKETEGIPLRIFVLAPPLVPPYPELEQSSPFPQKFFYRLLSSERCIGIGETYWPKVVGLEERSLKQYEYSEILKKTREGHAAGAKHTKLIAYAAAGTTSCHEAITAEEALERLRLGMAVMIREGYVRRELEAISGVARQPVDLGNVMIVTDLADPQELIYQGGMNLLLEKAVSLGFDPVKAVQMVTANVARYFGFRDIGGVAPGKIADMVVVDDLKTFHCHQVWTEGRLAAIDGVLKITIETYNYPETSKRAISIGKVSPDIFQIPTHRLGGKIRVVEIVNGTITREIVEQLKAVDGKWVSNPERDILKACVINKRQSISPIPVCFVKGFGIRKGAVATSLTWDTTNILIIGASDSDMAAALNRILSLGGGFVVIKEREVIAQLPLPVFGIISQEPVQNIVPDLAKAEDACRTLGCALTKPFLTLQTLPFTGLPYLRPTDKGLVDIRKETLVSLEV
jgi:adenine deaminase